MIYGYYFDHVYIESDCLNWYYYSTIVTYKSTSYGDFYQRNEINLSAMSILHKIKQLLWKIGLEVRRFNPSESAIAQRRQLISYYGIDLVLDVGANKGQFATELRRDLLYSGEIISFEPTSNALSILLSKARSDSKWLVKNYALGDFNGTSEINISANSYSSSLLEMLPSHIMANQDSAYISKEEITVRTLDTVFSEFSPTGRNILMKLDVQGFEENVLRGASKSLELINTIQIELSFIDLYKGEARASYMIDQLESKGFRPVAIEGAFTDPKTCETLQADVIFRRS